MDILILICENSTQKAEKNASGTRSANSAQRKREKEVIRLHMFREGLRSLGLHEEASLLTVDRVAVSSYGKPFFPDIPQAHISLSHSGKYMACAFSDAEIGLDLQECVIPRNDILSISRRFFTPEEYNWLLSASAEDCGRANEFFFRLWSIKEAYLKYIGCGLHGDLNSFMMDPLPGGPVISSGRGRISVLKKKDMLTPAEYSLLPAPDRYMMAVSAKKLSTDITIRYMNLRSEP